MSLTLSKFVGLGNDTAAFRGNVVPPSFANNLPMFTMWVATLPFMSHHYEKIPRKVCNKRVLGDASFAIQFAIHKALQCHQIFRMASI